MDRPAQARPPAASGELPRAELRRRREDRRRRRRRRLAPAALAVLLLLASVIWLATSRSAPSSGGATTTLHVAPSTTSTTVPYLPAAITLPVTPALPGEGRWAVRDAWAGSPPSVLTANYRPDPSNPSVFAYVSWIRTATTQLALYPGYKGPGSTSLSRGPEMVPPTARGHLLATFNSGFYEADSPGGFYTNGTLYFPMITGRATIVQYTNGAVDVIDWTGGPRPPADVAMARQNLTLLVNHSRPGAGVSIGSLWGLTLHGNPLVWRTAVGVDAHGDLLYVAAPLQSAASLATIMIQVGAVRAMQLDINPEWPIFVSYAGPGAAGPTLVVPNPNQIADRFLYPSTKDFFAVYTRTSRSAAIPW